MQVPDRTLPMPDLPRPSRRLRALVVTGGTAAAMLAAAAPSPAAEATAKATGTTTIKLSSAVKAVMKRSKVSLAGVAPARRGATAVKLPLRNATIDLAAASGTLEHAGALRFRRGKRTITVKTLRVAVAASGSSASVTVGRSRVRMFVVDTTKAKITPGRRKLTVSDLAVTFTPIGASRLNRALGVNRFKPGMAVGTASAAIDTPPSAAPAPAPATGTALRSGTTTLSLTPEAAAGLRASGASVTAIAPATGSGDGPFAFPITGGSLDGAKNFAGSATLAGGLRLTAGGATVTATDIVVDTANARITAIVGGGGERQELFSLDSSQLRNVAYEGQLVVDGIRVKRARSGPFAGEGDAVIGTVRVDAVTG